jgi:prepilin-type N-terminal cleavage/methylation domain-containing protein
MFGRRTSGRRARSGLTLVELLVAIAVLGGLEVLLFTLSSPPPEPAPPPLSFYQPPAPPMMATPPTPRVVYQGEMSLQTTLDRLGFTVNVPQDYHGRHLANWGPGHVSTRSDALPAGWFEASGPARFKAVSRQSSLRNETTFEALNSSGDTIELLPRGQMKGRWGYSQAAGTATRELRGRIRFALEFAPNGFNSGPFFSTAADNPGGGSQLLVLPARRGATWVSEGDNGEQGRDFGHWEGGAEDGGCLLCWEDVVHGDNDFQDLVVYAEGIQPLQR